MFTILMIYRSEILSFLPNPTQLWNAKTHSSRQHREWTKSTRALPISSDEIAIYRPKACLRFETDHDWGAANRLQLRPQLPYLSTSVNMIEADGERRTRCTRSGFIGVREDKICNGSMLAWLTVFRQMPCGDTWWKQRSLFHEAVIEYPRLCPIDWTVAEGPSSHSVPGYFIQRRMWTSRRATPLASSCLQQAFQSPEKADRARGYASEANHSDRMIEPTRRAAEVTSNSAIDADP